MKNEIIPDRQEKFRIAAILSRTEIIMNAGIDKNVRVGSRFAIVDHIGLSIRDPQTREYLGRIPSYKYLLQVVTVMDQFSILRTIASSEERSSAYISRLRTLNTSAPEMKVADSSQILDYYDRYTGSPIEIGDQLLPVSGSRSY